MAVDVAASEWGEHPKLSAGRLVVLDAFALSVL